MSLDPISLFWLVLYCQVACVFFAITTKYAKAHQYALSISASSIAFFFANLVMVFLARQAIFPSSDAAWLWITTNCLTIIVFFWLFATIPAQQTTP